MSVLFIGVTKRFTFSDKCFVVYFILGFEIIINLPVSGSTASEEKEVRHHKTHKERRKTTRQSERVDWGWVLFFPVVRFSSP